jgi:hypothetical protein
MAYQDFTLEMISKIFDLTIEERVDLFADVPVVEISSQLAEYLSNAIPLALAISTEKARSELLIAPLLVEVRKMHHNQISMFSGIEFNIDPSRGLNGVCDFLISEDYHQTFVRRPVIVIIEAKNENIKGGYAQCIATMLAARIFNEQENNPHEPIYGAVTTGNQWKFLKLEAETAYIDLRDYYIERIEKIMGILYTIGSPHGTGEA